MFNYKPDKVLMESLISKDDFGSYYPYRSKDGPNGEKWMVNIQSANDANLPLIMQEIDIGRSCKHPNILPIETYCLRRLQGQLFSDNKWEVYLKVPRMVTLKHKLESRQTTQQPFPEEEILQYFYEIACGLKHLHREKGPHCDIRPSNIFVDQDGRIKIAKAGRLYQKNKNGREKKSLYTAPELWKQDYKQNKVSGCQADLWSLGITILELCSRPNPVSSGTALGLITAALAGGTIGSLVAVPVLLYGVFSNSSPPNRTTPESESKLVEKQIFEWIARLEEKYSPQFIKLLYELLKSDPNLRITAEELEARLEKLVYIKHNETDKEKSTEYGHEKNMIIGQNLQAQFKYREEEIKDRQGNVLTVRGNLQEKIGDFFTVTASQIDRSLEIQNKQERVNNDLKAMAKTLFQELQMQNCLEIKSLTVKIRSCPQVEDLDVVELLYRIDSNFAFLEKLHLDFSSCEKITDLSLKELAFVCSNLQNLQHLELHFIACDKITDSGLQLLTSHFNTHLRYLQHLRLDFSTCNQITDSSLKVLASKLPRNLQGLKLDFSWCEKITDSGLKELAQKIGLLKNIEQIQLCFAWCERITNTGIEILVSEISFNLTKLSLIHLDFTECEKIIGSCLEEIALKIFESKLNLKDLQLYFSSSRFKDELQQRVRDTFKEIPNFILG